MSIAPVSSFPPPRSEPSTNASTSGVLSHSQARPASNAAEEPEPTISGSLPKQEDTIAKKISSTYELPADVVEVHQDPEIKNQVIIQYLDQARDVVLQVPSNQELGVERGIAEEFQEAAKLQATESAAASTNEGEKIHGD
jgi:hypothetical protein